MTWSSLTRADTTLGVDVHEQRQPPAWTWLLPHARFAEDTDRTHNQPQQVLNSPSLAWQQRPEAILSLGYGTSAWWIHVPLHNSTDEPAQRIVEIAEPAYDDLQFWVLLKGHTLDTARMGDRIPFSSRPIIYRHPAIQVTLPPHATVDLLIRADAWDGEHDPLPLRLWQVDAFKTHILTDTLAYGAYFGAGLILLIYNLLVFASTRERSFLWYAIYLGSFLAWNFTFRGLSHQYLWPTRPEWNALAYLLLITPAYLSLLVFTQVLLDLRRHTPVLFRASTVLAALMALHVPVALIAPEIGIFATFNPLGLMLHTVLLLAAIRICRGGNITAWIYTAAIGCMYLSSLPYYLHVFGFLEANLLTIHAANIGSAIEFALLALALAHRINSLKAEKLRAEKQAFDILNQSTQALEIKVRERTEALEEANRSLHELAVRDALSGLYNRRHFNNVVQQELSRGKRFHKPLALLLLDLDDFKKLNDHAGHQTGDSALAQIGQLLNTFAQRSVDLAFRVGGEEFAIIALEARLDRLKAWAEQLRHEVEAMAFPHPSRPGGCLTVSIGITESRTDDTLESLYARADQALYRAKGEGRNRVVADLTPTTHA